MRCRLQLLSAMAGLLLAAATPACAEDAALVAAAKKEGQVVWYTTLIVNQAIRPLKEAFEAKYPGVTLQFSRADDGPTALKLLSEGRAGHVQADVFDGLYNMIMLQRAGLVAPYRVPNFDAYPADLKDKDGNWTAILLYVFAPGINTAAVPKDQAPKTYQDLLDPKWKGRMAWNPSSFAGGPGFIGHILTSMGENKGMDYLKRLARQEVVNVEASSRAILDQVIAGEYAIGLMMFNHHTVISAAKGAPTTWLKIEPIAVAFDAIAVLKDAQHPNAARLLADFLTSPEGQTVIQKAAYLPALPGVPAMATGLKPDDGHFAANYLRPEQIDAQMPRWSGLLNQMFR
jgi:iron(III) transport system substrate-binding protein